MFCTRTIELHTLPHNLPTALIPREMLAEQSHANQILEHAQLQAQALIRQAESQCEKMLESASDEFWKRANAQLHQWTSERQTMFDNLEHTATSVINTAIRGLLEETVPAQRLTVLLNKLLAVLIPTVEANLLCNPLDREPVEQWLSRHCDVPWTLRVDRDLAVQSLLLETEDGGFHINWTNALDHLMEPPSRGKPSDSFAQ